MSAYPTLQRAVIRAVKIPIAPLRTASGVIETCPLVLIDLVATDGVTGCAYVFAYTPMCLEPLGHLIHAMVTSQIGQPIEPLSMGSRLSGKFRLVGAGGLVAMALGGIDMALWDAHAKRRGVPLAILLGGELKALNVYWSAGMCTPTEARHAAERALAVGCSAMKVKIGHPEFDDDLEVIRAIRDVSGPALQLMVDYNQSLTIPEAIHRAQRLAEVGVAWIEEPTIAEDFAGHASIASESALPIQLGENWSSALEMAHSIAVHASDLAMIDVMKIGGVTGWLRAAALAHVHGLPVSSHIFPEISAHLLTVTPTAHWLEYLDLASIVLQTPVKVDAGHVAPSDAPGIGVDWNESAVEKHIVFARAA